MMKKQLQYKEKLSHGSREFPVMAYSQHGFVPYHWHNEYEFICITEGSGEYFIDTDVFALSAGDCAFCKSGQLHSLVPTRGDTVTFEALVFDLAFLVGDIDICNQFFSGDYVIHHCFSPKNTYENEIILLIREICNVFHRQAFGYELTVKMLILKVFTLIFDCHLYQTADSRADTVKMHDSLIRVISYIHEHYNDQINVHSLAELMGYSISHFSRSFKTAIGKTPIEYITSYRLYRACELLRSGNTNVLETAYECGFHHVNYFIKAFKKQYGITPHQYKKRV